MLLVATYLDKSNIHGIGLFAGEDIPVGTRIWEFNKLIDIIMTPAMWEEYKALPSTSIDTIFVYKQGGLYYLSLDHDRFINHSKNDFNISNGKYHHMFDDYTYAIRDIKKGEELICDYTEFMDEDILMTMPFIFSSHLSVA